MDDVKKPANHKPSETRLTTSQGKMMPSLCLSAIPFVLCRLLSVQPFKLWEIKVHSLQLSATLASPSSPGEGGDRSQKMKVQIQLQFRDITILLNFKYYGHSIAFDTYIGAFYLLYSLLFKLQRRFQSGIEKKGIFHICCNLITGCGRVSCSFSRVNNSFLRLKPFSTFQDL